MVQGLIQRDTVSRRENMFVLMMNVANNAHDLNEDETRHYGTIRLSWMNPCTNNNQQPKLLHHLHWVHTIQLIYYLYAFPNWTQRQLTGGLDHYLDMQSSTTSFRYKMQKNKQKFRWYKKNLLEIAAEKTFSIE